KASKVNISLRISEDALKLVIEDNGKGFDTANIQQAQQVGISRGFGIEGMKERVELINGMIDIHSTLLKGTVIQVQVPLK
ncbi:MAG: histidine kinase, partial [Clostridia bacterium]|nr:histidine kinase [Clostridia bacterium]